MVRVLNAFSKFAKFYQCDLPLKEKIIFKNRIFFLKGFCFNTKIRNCLKNNSSPEKSILNTYFLKENHEIEQFRLNHNAQTFQTCKTQKTTSDAVPKTNDSERFDQRFYGSS